VSFHAFGDGISALCCEYDAAAASDIPGGKTLELGTWFIGLAVSAPDLEAFHGFRGRAKQQLAQGAGWWSRGDLNP
jgi:hypothetical protein